MTTIDYANKLSYEGKTAVVTGSAGIIGQELCRGLLQLGAQVIAFDINEEKNTQLADELPAELKNKFTPCLVDLADPLSIKNAVNAIDKNVTIDAVFNNAAWKTKDLTQFFAPTGEYSLKTWQDVCKVNLDAVFILAQEFGKIFQKQKHGAMIITSSIYGIMAPDQRIYEGSEYMGHAINTPAVYSATKSAVIGLMRYLASLWGEYSVRVNAVTPGGVYSGQNEVFESKYSARTMLGRMAMVDDIVSAMLFLASDAASYVTGQNLVVDGGLSAW